MAFNSETWWKNNIKFETKLKNKSLRQKTKDQLRKGEWSEVVKKLPIVKDDGT